MRKYDVVVEQVEYGPQGAETLLATLYRPRGKGPFPAIVDVHGGAWVGNDRMANEWIDRSLAERGVIVMAIDFRMPPEYKYPIAVSDVNLAIRWLKTRSTSFGSRPDLIGGLGTSSGGHLLMLNALLPKDPRYADQPIWSAEPVDAGLSFVMLCWPVVDPSARYKMVTRAGRENLIEAHHAFWRDEAEMAEGNPQLILERGEEQARPPLLIIQGTADENLTPDMAENFAATYHRSGGSVLLRLYAGDEHSFITRNPRSPSADRAIADLDSFIKERSAVAPAGA